MALSILIPIGAFGRAGGYRVLSELANHWIELGAQVDFLVDARSDPPYFPTRAGIRRYDRAGRDVPAGAPVAGFAARGGNAWSILAGMWRALRRMASDYDVVLANHSLTALPVAFAPRPRRARFYYVQAYEPEYYGTLRGVRARVLQALSWISYRLPLVQVANAPLYIGYRSIRAREWVPPGLDLALFRRREEPQPRRRRTIGTIGRPEPARGTPDVLAAFERLAHRRPDLHLSIAYGNLPNGWSHPRAEVVEPGDDGGLGAWYRSLDALIAVPWLQLGACHYPVLEAMACGVPVVTTGFMPADGDNAWIVPVGRPDAIADAIEQIIGAPPPLVQDKVERAAADVAPFAWPDVARRFLAILDGNLGALAGASEKDMR